LIAVLVPSAIWTVLAQTDGREAVSYADAAPVFDALRADLLPTEFRDRTPTEREAAWPSWVAHRDAEIRARIAAGEDDSAVNFLLYGTSFTKTPRPTEREVGDLVTQPARAVVWLRARIVDFVAGLAAPGTNERLAFARDVLGRHGIDPSTPSGKADAGRYLEERALAMSAAGAVRTGALLDRDGTELPDRLTLFRDRGLSSDTSIFIDYGIDAALEAVRRQGLVAPASVRRVAIIGPGLDFSDKLDGYDFYPLQTIQPFAVIDSLMRLGVASRDLRVTAFDISPRVLQHFETARARARGGRAYALVLPRNLEQAWSRGLMGYWRQMGGRIGGTAPPPAAPPNAGRADVRSVLVRPAVVASTESRDLNVVLGRSASLSPPERFDLIVATNIFLYYDVFEQSLAGINVSRMLRPGGLLLTNNRIFELPSTPLTGVGFTDVTYITIPGIGSTGDRIIWYQRPAP